MIAWYSGSPHEVGAPLKSWISKCYWPSNQINRFYPLLIHALIKFKQFSALRFFESEPTQFLFQSDSNCLFPFNAERNRQLYHRRDVSICRVPTDLALTVSTILLAMNNRRANSPGRNIPALITRGGGEACDPRGEHVQLGAGDDDGATLEAGIIDSRSCW